MDPSYPKWKIEMETLLSPGVHSVFLITLPLVSNIRAFSNWFKYIPTRLFSWIDLFNRIMALQSWQSDCYRECQTGQGSHNPRWRRTGDQLCQNSPTKRLNSQSSPLSRDYCLDWAVSVLRAFLRGRWLRGRSWDRSGRIAQTHNSLGSLHNVGTPWQGLLFVFTFTD